MSKSLDRLSLLTTFVRIAERGSISAAARDLGLSQATASRHLSELEVRIGAIIVERTTHSLSLTEAGLGALEDARNLLNGWASLSERFDATDELTGTLKIIAPIALGQMHLVDAVLDWQKAHANLRLNWQLDDSEINLAETGADVWIRVGRPRDDRLIVRDLSAVERLIVANPETIEREEINDPSSLKGIPAVSLAPFEGMRLPLTKHDGSTATIDADSVFNTNNIFAALHAARKGVGYAVLPLWLIMEDLKSGSLVDVLPDWRAPALTITSCYLPSRRTSRALNTFLDVAEKALADIAV